MASEQVSVTVVGDVILDQYWHGTVAKPNPEGPGVVVHCQRVEYRLGGAASVAILAAGMGARVTLGGFFGFDADGQIFNHLLAKAQVSGHLYQSSDRRTTVKTRYVIGGRLHPDRFDVEDRNPLPDSLAEKLAAIELGDVLLMQDYGKGVCTPYLVRSLIHRAQTAGVPVLVDPARGQDWSLYQGCHTIKANQAEFLDQRWSADEVLQRLNCNLIVTEGANGMNVFTPRCGSYHVPAVPAEVVDVCGAGDTVLAAIGVELARRRREVRPAWTDGHELRDACQVAARLAAQQVGQLGVRAVKVA